MKIKIYIFYVLSLTVLLILWKKQRFFYKKSTTSFNLRHSCSVWTSEEFDYTSGYLQSGNFSTMLVVVFQICKSFMIVALQTLSIAVGGLRNIWRSCKNEVTVKYTSIKDPGLERGYIYVSYVPLWACDGIRPINVENFVPLPSEVGV